MKPFRHLLSVSSLAVIALALAGCGIKQNGDKSSTLSSPEAAQFTTDLENIGVNGTLNDQKRFVKRAASRLTGGTCKAALQTLANQYAAFSKAQIKSSSQNPIGAALVSGNRAKVFKAMSACTGITVG